jgi:hypothetical protein
MRLSKAFDML